VPRQFLELLNRETIVDVALGDQVERRLTVLFSDIRQFTALSERMTPRENFAFLNTYLERIGPKIRENGGFIDKYVGDAIMALFPDSLESAIRAGIDIQRELALFNESQRDSGKPEIEVGIGIHQDLMALGTIGEEGRMDTTVIADAVNLASRLEALSKIYGPGIIMMESLLDKIPARSSFRYRKMGPCHIRGKRDSHQLVQIYDGLSPARQAKIDESMPDWDLAIKAFLEGDYETAKALFGRIVDRDSEDLAATYFYVQTMEDVTELS
jgi:two-component system sensor histidine kinase ChiS